MSSVAIHPPKTPVTKGSMGIAKATIPNICKMPGPPAPFVPAPLPNIAKSGMSPKGYSTTVKIEGNAVAIRGATFASMGDIASKATGGGLISANTHGPAKFITPGSMTVKIQGKSVHLLSEPMLNNLGASGMPPNTGATMMGLSQGSTDVDEKSPPEKKCASDDDHVWKEAVSGDSADAQVAKLDHKIADLQGKPSRVAQMRGDQFEKKAVLDNKDKLPIDKCGKEYVCTVCGQTQEVDIVGGDRVAEAKSRNAKGVKNKGAQCRRLKGIQRQLFDPEKKPLAKIDGGLSDVGDSKAIYERRGFEVEVVS